jgi:hypothetical protein
MRHHDLLGHRLLMSGHQPTLFGNTGYWSKMHAVDLHIVTPLVPFRRQDHLGQMVIDHGHAVTAPIEQRGEFIKDCVVLDVTKVKRAIAQTYGARSMPYRERIDPILEALDQYKGAAWYMDVWMDVYLATCEAANIANTIIVDRLPPQGLDTMDKLSNRIDRLSVEKCDAYLSGPGALGYLRPQEGRTFFIHRMTEPKPQSFLHAIVTMECPEDALHAYAVTQFAVEGVT